MDCGLRAGRTSAQRNAGANPEQCEDRAHDGPKAALPQRTASDIEAKSNVSSQCSCQIVEHYVEK